MGTDDLFKKRREERKQRKYGYKQPKTNSFLIVTEGERTEPLYFQGIKKLIQDKIGGRVDVVEIDIHGQGCSTGKLIEMTDEIVSKSKFIYQNVWVLFDKDDFKDFDKAIEDGEERGYKIAWSNQSFEYWIYLHFNYSDSALHRDDWNAKLDDLFKKYQLGSGKYQKNYEDIYLMLDSFDGVNTAIKNAKRRRSDFRMGDKPSEFDPGTTVHLLVELLKSYLDE
ncbi:RloB family protein [Anaerovorax sp. IOR16]|uniref:RloB family protein n=1 Tax=Anaerovorax sp. IOR16 TaxID=2773458 RepID=UPI0019D0FCE5